MYEEVKTSTYTGIWKKLISTLIDDFEGFKTIVKEVIADMVGKERKLELEMKPEDVAVLLQPHDKSLKDGELLLMDEQNGF